MCHSNPLPNELNLSETSLPQPSSLIGSHLQVSVKSRVFFIFPNTKNIHIMHLRWKRPIGCNMTGGKSAGNGKGGRVKREGRQVTNFKFQKMVLMDRRE